MSCLHSDVIYDYVATNSKYGVMSEETHRSVLNYRSIEKISNDGNLLFVDCVEPIDK